MDKVKERGKQLGALLEDIKAKHKSVGDVRYIGLFSCVELTKDKATHESLSFLSARTLRALWARYSEC